MSLAFQKIIEQVPTEVMVHTKATVNEKIGIFRPRAYITDRLMSSEYYNFVVLTSTPPPARIGGREYQFRKSDLIAIDLGVDYFCNVNVPTQEFLNITVTKGFFEEICREATGCSKVNFPEVGYPYSTHLLKNILDLEEEMTEFSGECPLMQQSMANQLIIQLLRDTRRVKGVFKRRKQNEKKYIKRALDYLLDSDRANMDMEQICKELDLSPYHFICMFKEGTGADPHSYLQNVQRHYKLNYERLMRMNNYLPKNIRLTLRELEICVYLLERYDYLSISERLFISLNTLKVHIKHIYEKLEISKRRDLGERIDQLYYSLVQPKQ